jgi:hypothetical protein
MQNELGLPNSKQFMCNQTAKISTFVRENHNSTFRVANFFFFFFNDIHYTFKAKLYNHPLGFGSFAN